jgi:hypothetical protein
MATIQDRPTSRRLLLAAWLVVFALMAGFWTLVGVAIAWWLL